MQRSSREKGYQLGLATYICLHWVGGVGGQVRWKRGSSSLPPPFLKGLLLPDQKDSMGGTIALLHHSGKGAH